jgi:asparagine synthetase B (glutamine-hydrolysing)
MRTLVGYMISRLAVPLSTPSEVAIYKVASELGKHAKVAVSGEGADEFFAGYVHPLRQFQEFLKGNWL